MTKHTISQTVQDALNLAETRMQSLEPDAQFLITAHGGVEIVLRAEDGETAEPKELVARLPGCDPSLWRPEHPAGAVALGRPYRGAAPYCAISGAPIVERAPIELYWLGRPVSAEKALGIDPRLTLIRGLVLRSEALLAEIDAVARGLGEVENGELRALLAERQLRSLASRLLR